MAINESTMEIVTPLHRRFKTDYEAFKRKYSGMKFNFEQQMSFDKTRFKKCQIDH